MPTDALTAIVQPVLEAYRHAWDAGDADAFSELFTEDATYVIFLGDVLIGRTAIRDNHVDVFGTWQRGTALEVRALEVRKLADGVVSVLTVGGIGTDAIEIDKFQTFTLVRTSEGWRIAAFHNTQMSRWTMPAYNSEGGQGS